MGKYFPITARHAKAREFLKLKQGVMTVMEYMAKLTELARFAADYVAINMTKVKKFEDGLKLSIRGKTVGFLLQDMDSMVRISMAIERDRGCTEHPRCGSWWQEEGELVFFKFGERSRRLLVLEGFRDRATTTMPRID